MSSSQVRTIFRYLRGNAGGRANVLIKAEAIGADSGLATLFVEDLTGQNNSLGAVYSQLATNEERAHVRAHITQVEVPVVSLDQILQEDGPKVDLIKIDIEGGELHALRGARKIMALDRPIIMVEVTESQPEVAEILRGEGYELFSPEGMKLSPDNLSINVFAFHQVAHSQIIKGLSG